MMQMFRNVLKVCRNQFHTTAIWNHIQKETRLRVVDNSEIGKRAMAEGKPPRVINIYYKKFAKIGDKVLVAIKGEKRQGLIVGLKAKQLTKVPKFDSNNVVLLDEKGNPLGTRIQVPVPMVLRTILRDKSLTRGSDYTKLLAIATKYI